MSITFESRHHGVVFLNKMFIAEGVKVLDENSVGVAVKHDHYILVTTAGTNWKSTCIVRVDFVNRFYSDVHFVRYL